MAPLTTQRIPSSMQTTQQHLIKTCRTLGQSCGLTPVFSTHIPKFLQLDPYNLQSFTQIYKGPTKKRYQLNASLQQKILTSLVSELCDRIFPLLLVRLSALGIRKARDIEDLQSRHRGSGIPKSLSGHFDDLLRVRLRTVGELAASNEDWALKWIYIIPYIHYSILLHYISLHYISFHYISFHYITFHYISFHYITSHFITLQYVTFHYISMHYISLHFMSLITFHCITLHYITCIHTYIHIYIYIHTHTHIYIYIHMHILHTHTHTYIYIYIYTYIYIYICFSQVCMTGFVVGFGNSRGTLTNNTISAYLETSSDLEVLYAREYRKILGLLQYGLWDLRGVEWFIHWFAGLGLLKHGLFTVGFMVHLHGRNCVWIGPSGWIDSAERNMPRICLHLSSQSARASWSTDLCHGQLWIPQRLFPAADSAAPMQDSEDSGCFLACGAPPDFACPTMLANSNRPNPESWRQFASAASNAFHHWTRLSNQLPKTLL